MTAMLLIPFVSVFPMDMSTGSDTARRVHMLVSLDSLKVSKQFSLETPDQLLLQKDTRILITTAQEPHQRQPFVHQRMLVVFSAK